MSADILGLFQTIHGSGAYKCDIGISLVCLIIINLSILQVPFDLDFSIGSYRKQIESRKGGKLTLRERFDNPEVRTILMNMFMHEAPFLIMRIYILAPNILTPDLDQGVVFFGVKNVLFLALQGYRLWILMKDGVKESEEENNDDFENENEAVVMADLIV